MEINKNVCKNKFIANDDFSIMLQAITFLHTFNPNQFEIIQFRKGNDGKDLKINGKTPFFRILIKKKTMRETDSLPLPLFPSIV